MEEVSNKKRRIIIDEDEDEDEIISNPDEILDENPEDEEEGEDLNENWIDDYAPAPELDTYDQAMLDDNEIVEDYEKIANYRMAADEAMDARDLKRKERELQTEHNLERINRFEQAELDQEDEQEDDLADGAERALNLEAFECPLREWIAEERTRREISRRFRKFLLTYYVGIDEVTSWVKRHEHIKPLPPMPAHLKQAPPIYPEKIRKMCLNNSSSFEISYGHLAEMQSLLAIWLTDVPRDMLQLFDEVLQSVTLVEFPYYYSKMIKETHVRINNLPILDRLRDLRQGDLNGLIRVAGVITRRTGVFPQMKAVAYDCGVCGTTLGPYKLTGIEVRPDSCASCGSKGPFNVNQQKTEYGNYQKITLQETPGTVPPGRVPRYKEVILLGDLIDIARPGEEVEVTGIYMHSQQTISKRSNGFPVFSTVIEANCVHKLHGSSSTLLSEEDKRKIKELGADKQIGERIIRSIAPSIYGHRHVKTGVALALFGGCHKDDKSSSGGMHRIRGDINLLLLGDPGTAKSQILKYAEKTAPRAVYTAGKGASAVGLTAGVHKDPVTKEWTLEGGALVLADQGVCLIDEFDKMNEQDRTSIHEAMEQQTISVSKAGIVTSLQARCAVIAAANPIGGRYDPSFSFAENVELTDPILQRFDVLCVLQDVVDPIVDERLATFVVGSHYKSHPRCMDHDTSNGDDRGDSGVAEEDNDDDDGAFEEKNNSSGRLSHAVGDEFDQLAPQQRHGSASGSGSGVSTWQDDGPAPIDQSLLRKYISYARSHHRPVLHQIDIDKVSAFYAEMREVSKSTGGVPVAVRHLESMMRMAEASARMHLRDYVNGADMDMAIKVMLESFLQAQKISVRKSLQRSFRKYLNFGEANNQLLMHKLQGLLLEAEKYKLTTKNAAAKDKETSIYISALDHYCTELSITTLEPFFKSALFKNHGLRVDGDMIVKMYV